MPRLSLWSPRKGNDYTFIDNLIRAQFHHGGTGVFVHKYIGTHDQGDVNDATQPNYIADGHSDVPEIDIQDILFLENRDRKYDDAVFDIRGVYNLQDNDFDLSQFGVFLTNDTIFMTFHINEMIEIIGRKLIPGDVLELPHLADDTALDNSSGALRKFYVIEDSSRSSDGFDPGWWPHIWRIKAVPLQDTVEYRDILGDADQEDSLKNLMSTYNKEVLISDTILEQADSAVPSRGVDIAHLFIDEETFQPGIAGHDGIPTNANPVSAGVTFPQGAVDGDYFLRTDYVPNRLYKKSGDKWIKIEDDLRNIWSATSQVVNSFVNNTNTLTIDGVEVDSQQSLTNIIKPKADF